VQRAAQFRLRIAALVDRGAGVPEILHVDCAVIGAVEFRRGRQCSRSEGARIPEQQARSTLSAAYVAPPERLGCHGACRRT
jgi:hypothetical protein